MKYAEEINYWKTSSSSPDNWLEKAKKQIVILGGKILAEMAGTDQDGRAGFLLAFEIQGEKYKINWPVLPVRNEKDQRAARIQAATMLYHDIKAKCMSAAVKGVKVSFFEYYMLPDGRTTVEASYKELMDGIPKLLSWKE